MYYHNFTGDQRFQAQNFSTWLGQQSATWEALPSVDSQPSIFTVSNLSAQATHSGGANSCYSNYIVNTS